MAIKLIAFDMDDTLLLDDRTIGERTMRALRAAHEQGVRIVPATGRGKHSMWNYVEQIGVADAAICTNGAQVYDGAGRPIREATMEELLDVPGMNRPAAEAVYAFFHAK